MEISHQFRFSRFLGSILGGLLVCTGFGACTAGEAPEQLTLSGEVRIAASLWADLGPQDAIGPVYLVVTDAKKGHPALQIDPVHEPKLPLASWEFGSPQRPAAGESLTVRFEGMPRRRLTWRYGPVAGIEAPVGSNPLGQKPDHARRLGGRRLFDLTDLGADPGAGPRFERRRDAARCGF